MTLIIQKPTGAKLVFAKDFSFDADAAAYIAAVEAADTQTLETNTRYAINNFVIGCKQDGIWTAIKASCILAGARTLTGALVPLAGTAPALLGTEAGWNYARKTGLQGNGTNNAIDTNQLNNAQPQNSKHVALRFGSTGGAGITYWSSSGVGATSGNTSGDSGAGGRYGANGVATSNVPGLPTSNTLLGVSRFSATQMDLRLNGNTLLYALNSGSPSSLSILLQARRNASTNALESFRSDRLAFYSIGESLNLALLDARVTDLINAFAAAIP
jgi:hypothetical protein